MRQTDRSVLTVCWKEDLPRGKGGQAHGDSCVKPNGTVRRSNSNSSKPVSEPAPFEPLKQWFIIKQDPTPLYRSDEHQLTNSTLLTPLMSLVTIPIANLPSPHNSFSSLPSRSHKTLRATPPVQPALRSSSPTPIAATPTLPHSTASHPSSAKSLCNRGSTSRSNTSPAS